MNSVLTLLTAGLAGRAPSVSWDSRIPLMSSNLSVQAGNTGLLSCRKKPYRALGNRAGAATVSGQLKA